MKLKIKKNWIDKAVEYISPVKGLKRSRARAFLALSGAYKGASSSRRSMSEWSASRGSADADIIFDLPKLRERSRDLVRNAPLATGAINTVITNVVGPGLKLQARPDRDVLKMTDDQAEAWESNVESEFKLWAESKDCDITRISNFYSLQDLAFRRTLEDGDSICLLPRVSRKNQPYNLRLQIIEADRLCNENYQANTNLLCGGVEKNSDGSPTQYHILDQHPGNIINLSSATWTKVKAFGKNTGLRNVIHLYRILRPGQTRGIPYLAPVIETLKQIDQYTEAEIMAAVIAGMYTIFIHSEDDSGLDGQEPIEETGAQSTDSDIKMGYGAVVGLSEGEKIETANPGRPNVAFDGFTTSILRQIGVALEIPFEILIKHFTASYSAAQAALLEAWKFFLSRRVWLAENFCQEIYEIWMFEAVARGRVSAPGFFNDPLLRKAYCGAEWVGPARGMIDETKSVRAAQERVDGLFSTIAYEAKQMTGMDFEKIFRQRVKETKMKNELNKIIAPVIDVATNDNNDEPINDKGDSDDETK